MSGGVDGPPVRIAVVGGATASEPERTLAEAVGAAVAKAGAVLVCGGHGGVMEAAARGAYEHGGLTVGILPGTEAAAANPWIVVPLPTGMGEARNALVVRAAEAVVAIGGEWGTLSEIALARKLGVGVITLGAPPAKGLGLPSAEDPNAAVAWALETAFRCRESEAAQHFSADTDL